MSKSSNNNSAEYVIALLNDGNFSVAKFQGGYEPEAVYTVKPSETEVDRYSCDCPCGIYRGYMECKHVHMIRELRQKQAA